MASCPAEGRTGIGNVLVVVQDWEPRSVKMHNSRHRNDPRQYARWHSVHVWCLGMTQGVEHHVLWHCSLLSSSEHASLLEAEDGHRFEGVVVVPLGDLPCHIDYALSVDRHWRPREAQAKIVTPRGVREIHLRSRHGDGWELDGVPAPHFGACADIDLGWTPATNTIPIRRLKLEVGETSSITAVWVRFPELDVVRNEQRYTRLASDRWRYQSGDYDFELVTDAATGLVLVYGGDLWRASALSLG